MEDDFRRYKAFLDLVIPARTAREIEKEEIEAERLAIQAAKAAAAKQAAEEWDDTPKQAAVAKTDRERLFDRAAEAGSKSIPGTRYVRVFMQNEVDHALTRGRDKAVKVDLDAASRLRGYRTIPKFKGIEKGMNALGESFPNMRHAIELLTEELALAAAMPPEEFRVSPILLNGQPGIGKTALCMKIAENLGLWFEQLNAGGLQNGAQIVGSSSHWSDSRPSQFFTALAHGEHATLVVLIDEVDKVSRDSRYQVLPALLSLLEPTSSSRMKCECTNVEFDLSRLIIIATSNEKERIYPALLSRFHVIDVEPPTEAQRREIAMKIHASMNRVMKKRIELDEDAMDNLAKADCDLRELTRAIRSGFAKAVVSKNQVSFPVSLSERQETTRRIGF